jgi:protein O-mannosyl-transferase
VKPSIDIRSYWRIPQLALIVLGGAAVYSHTLHGQFVLDDDAIIRNYGPLDILTILLHGGSRRVVDASFALNHLLHCFKVPGYHLVNLAVHLSAAVALYFLVVSTLAALRQSFDSAGETAQDTAFIDRFVPFCVALLFTLHPVQTQAVTYLTQRYTSLATLFYLLSALFFIRARLARERSGTLRYPLFLAAVSLATGILAIGSKQIAATLPVMLVTLELFLFRGRLINRRFYIVCGTTLVLALAMTLTVWHDRSLHDFLVSLHHATAENRYMSRVTYLLTQTRVVATYLRLLCLPLGQSLFYDYPLSTTLFSLPVVAALCLHISLLAAAGLLFRSSRENLLAGRQPQGILQRLAALGIVWFYVAMLVESSIFPITDVIFEHRIYLPSAGFFLTTASLAAYAAHGRRAGIRAAWSLFAITAIILGALTIARNRIWSDTFLLWQDTVRKAPGKDLALANLAGEYMKLGMPDKALPLYVRALVLNPEYMTMTKVYLGMTLQRLNIDGSRFTTGEEILSPYGNTGNRELQPSEQTRLDCIMFNNLGLAYEHLGEPDKARGYYNRALLINPAYDLAWYNLGLIYVRLGDREQFDRALLQLKSLNPGLADSLAADVKK